LRSEISDRVERSEDAYVAISALQHWLFCPRQCALIHVEQMWSENRYTAEGRVLHERAHEGPHELREGVRITRGLPVSSKLLGISGICDIVEFHPDGTIVPVEYKRGRPKSHRADEVQLCAQSLCLEEMLDTTIEAGHLYYGKSRRRTEIAFDEPLRRLTEDTALEIHQCFDTGETPESEYIPERCDRCSLIDLCQPKSMRFKRGAKVWFDKAVASAPASQI